MKIRNAFTMIELIFVIVIMGILAKFGVEFLAQAYRTFIFSSVNHTLQSNGQYTVEFIANRLQHRIKDSIIGKKADGSFVALANVVPSEANDYVILEWVSADEDGFRATTLPNWSGIIDVNNPTAITGAGAILVSPETNTSAISALIGTLSNGTSSIADAALFFVGSNSNINDYGWDGVAFTNQTKVMHPIKANGVENQFVPIKGTDGTASSFTGIDVYEYYKLSWTANAVVVENYNTTTKMGNLVFYYDYQPWKGETYKSVNAKHQTIMENVSTFQSMAIGSIVKIQVCVKSNLVEEYSLCKEKTIF